MRNWVWRDDFDRGISYIFFFNEGPYVSDWALRTSHLGPINKPSGNFPQKHHWLWSLGFLSKIAVNLAIKMKSRAHNRWVSFPPDVGTNFEWQAYLKPPLPQFSIAPAKCFPQKCIDTLIIVSMDKAQNYWSVMCKKGGRGLVQFSTRNLVEPTHEWTLTRLTFTESSWSLARWILFFWYFWASRKVGAWWHGSGETVREHSTMGWNNTGR